MILNCVTMVWRCVRVYCVESLYKIYKDYWKFCFTFCVSFIVLLQRACQWSMPQLV